MSALNSLCPLLRWAQLTDGVVGGWEVALLTNLEKARFEAGSRRERLTSSGKPESADDIPLSPVFGSLIPPCQLTCRPLFVDVRQDFSDLRGDIKVEATPRTGEKQLEGRYHAVTEQAGGKVGRWEGREGMRRRVRGSLSS